MLSCDLLKQCVPALISCGCVCVVGYIVRGPWTEMCVGVSDRQILGEFRVTAEVSRVGRVSGDFWRPFAIRVTPIATDAPGGGERDQKRNRERAHPHC